MQSIGIIHPANTLYTS